MYDPRPIPKMVVEFCGETQTGHQEHFLSLNCLCFEGGNLEYTLCELNKEVLSC